MKLPFIEQNFLSATASFEESRIILLGCPFDGSASFRPGARFGPSAIRRASWGIETFSPYLRTRSQLGYPFMIWETWSYLWERRRCLLVSFERPFAGSLSEKKFPILLGGDHLITLPIVEEMLRVYPDLHLLQIDAHTDLREDYLGETLSHSTVMRRVVDHLGEGRLFQMGIRSGTEEEFRLAKRMKSIVSSDRASLRSMVRRLRNQPVYVSLDLDVIDPSLLPGVGTPEPGGFTFERFLSLLKELQSLHVIGFDMVELTPDYDPTQVSSVTASVILREMILAFC